MNISLITDLISDATVKFCHRFLDPRSRLIDPMVQAARSNQQSIAAASHAPATSNPTELRRVNIEKAKTSLGELLRVYEDFLRERHLRPWTKEDPDCQAIRSLGNRASSRASDYSHWFQSISPAIFANTVICLLQQALEFLAEQEPRLPTHPSDSPRPSDSPHQPRHSGTIPGAPSCPKCGKPMALRTARKGARPGSQFWGCVNYPNCNGVRRLE